VTVVFIAILAIANARLIRWLGAQRTALLGISLLGVGELSASFTTKSIAGLFITAGVIMGVGVR
jgi:Na+/melibiose symporter-like transporter